MADRVKYFLLGLLFLVVAGVIAYDRWNAAPPEVADRGDDSGWEVFVGTQPRAPSAKELSVPSNPAPPVKPVTTKPPVAKPVTERPPVPPQPKPVVVNKPRATVRKVHIIKAGETLESIALHYYKTRKGIQWIVDANSLKDPNRVYENQKLVIPARKVNQPKPQTPAQPRPATSPSKVPADGRYTVKSGDGDLYAICRRFYGAKGEGARVARIMELNHLWSAEVKTDTVLILPKK